MQKQLITLCLTCRTITTTHFHIFRTELLWVMTAPVMMVMMMMMTRTNDIKMNLKITPYTDFIRKYHISLSNK